MLDYLGYGTRWARVSQWRTAHRSDAVVDQPAGLEVGRASVTVARSGAVIEIRDALGNVYRPMDRQPAAKSAGSSSVGTEGTVSTYDYEPTVRLQTRSIQRPDNP